MIAADTSAWVDYSKAISNHRSHYLEQALSDGTLIMPMPVLFEILSAPGLTKDAHGALLKLPKLDVSPNLWENAGTLRRTLLKKGFKARAMDCLIAQNCIDNDIGLIAADDDYRHFTKHGLKLIK